MWALSSGFNNEGQEGKRKKRRERQFSFGFARHQRERGVARVGGVHAGRQKTQVGHASITEANKNAEKMPKFRNAIYNPDGTN